ncbi:MAG TPA: sulfurtransferase-like selenium metabolism protein YedF [Eubacteriaceae bacterium]|jgi:selenium metabolism protein YedF|nr:sulfurtransferase-like selenium metabolism protein YedF [Eubacteriaceae bacterium]
METIDCRGLSCPLPVVKTKKVLEDLKEGSIVTIVDNQMARENIKSLANKLNTTYEVEEKAGDFYITITKKQEPPEEDKGIDQSPNKNPGVEDNLVILIGNDKMGVGEEELGNILIKGYLYALTEVEPRPNKLIFVNNGVKLNCKGSDSIESIQRLEDLGVEILTCGTCLDYYDLKKDLQVGSISNMYTIVEALNQATNTIVL